VPCYREGKDPLDAFASAMTQLPTETVRFAPTENLFGLFALSLAHGVTRMASRSAINIAVKAPAMQVRCNVRRETQLADVPNEAPAIITSVGTDRPLAG